MHKDWGSLEEIDLSIDGGWVGKWYMWSEEGKHWRLLKMEGHSKQGLKSN